MSTDPARAFHARRAEQEAVMAMQAPPGPARDAHRAMCISHSRRVVDALRLGSSA